MGIERQEGPTSSISKDLLAILKLINKKKIQNFHILKTNYNLLPKNVKIVTILSIFF